MSKAFTREDDDAGFEAPASPRLVPAGALRLTAVGARAVRARADAGSEQSALLRDALARAEILAPVQRAPERAALGVTVVTCDAHGSSRRYRLVTPEERTLLGEGCSVASPIGRALLGAVVGDVREVVTPRGADELEVVALEGDDSAPEASSGR